MGWKGNNIFPKQAQNMDSRKEVKNTRPKKQGMVGFFVDFRRLFKTRTTGCIIFALLFKTAYVFGL
jgi:hypothetical protein